MTKVSIVVPVYNSEKLIERCLNSLLNQTIQDIEIICVNDGSTDNSEKKIKNFTDPRLKLITISHSGPSICRNKGMEIAAGEYIGFADSDDWVDLDYFEKLYNAACKYNADIAASGIIRIHKFGRKKYLNIEKEIYTTNKNEKFKICEIPDMWSAWNKIYKRCELEKYNIKFPERRLHEDIIFTPQAVFYLNGLVTVPDTYYYYWRTPNSIVTRKDSIAGKDHEYALKYAEQFFDKYNIDVSSYVPVIKKYAFLGINVFKIKTTPKYKEYRLFNFIKLTKFNKIQIK